MNRRCRWSVRVMRPSTLWAEVAPTRAIASLRSRRVAPGGVFGSRAGATPPAMPPPIPPMPSARIHRPSPEPGGMEAAWKAPQASGSPPRQAGMEPWILWSAARKGPCAAARGGRSVGAAGGGQEGGQEGSEGDDRSHRGTPRQGRRGPPGGGDAASARRRRALRGRAGGRGRARRFVGSGRRGVGFPRIADRRASHQVSCA